MRRDIKFRAKRLDNGEWVYGTYITGGHDRHFIGYDPTIVTVKDDLISGFKIIEVDPETVGQYIGIEDKNGEEIYEGMDVRPFIDGNPLEPLVIKYLENSFVMAQPDETKRMDCVWYFDFEIIHDSKEVSNG